MPNPVVSIKGLVKRYGGFTAVGGIDIEVDKGEVFGLLGPNGAGKTTTLECLEGMRKADAGKLLVAGLDPQNKKNKLYERLGVQLQSSSLQDHIRVEEIIQLITSWHGITTDQSLIEKFDIKDLLSKQYRQLSTGQKRRVNLVLAILHNPEVLILDEPTAGLDVQSRVKLHEEIRDIKARGITLILATHDMAEAEELCDRIAIMIRGKIAVCGSPEEVTAAGNKETRIILKTANNSLLPGTDLGGAVFVETRENYLEWVCRDIAPAVRKILERVEESDDAVVDLRVERPSLEERFLELVEGVGER